MSSVIANPLAGWKSQLGCHIVGSAISGALFVQQHGLAVVSGLTLIVVPFSLAAVCQMVVYRVLRQLCAEKPTLFSKYLEVSMIIVSHLIGCFAAAFLCSQGAFALVVTGVVVSLGLQIFSTLVRPTNQTVSPNNAIVVDHFEKREKPKHDRHVRWADTFEVKTFSRAYQDVDQAT